MYVPFDRNQGFRNRRQFFLYRLLFKTPLEARAICIVHPNGKKRNSFSWIDKIFFRRLRNRKEARSSPRLKILVKFSSVWRFGSSIPTDENVSYTMMEYEYAKSRGMRIIPLIYNGKESLDFNDLDINKAKFGAWVSRLSQSVSQYFKDETELIRKLTKALDNEMIHHPQRGWVRL